MLMLSPWRISCLFRPSKDTQAVFLASGDSIIIALHSGDEVPVQVDVHVGQVGGGASVNHHLVQDLGGRGAPPCTERLGSAPSCIYPQTALLLGSLRGSEDGGSPLGSNQRPQTLRSSPRL